MSKPRSDYSITISENQNRRMAVVANKLGLSPQAMVGLVIEWLVEDETANQEFNSYLKLLGSSIGKEGEAKRFDEGFSALAWAQNRNSQTTEALERAKTLLWDYKLTLDMEALIGQTKVLRRDLSETLAQAWENNRKTLCTVCGVNNVADHLTVVCGPCNKSGKAGVEPDKVLEGKVETQTT